MLILPDLTCSVSGSTAITYSLSNIPSSTVPAWVLINSTTGELNVTSPQVSADTEYGFYVNSNIFGLNVIIQKILKITVINCAVQYWQKWISSTIWGTCISGYILNSGVWSSPYLSSQPSTTAKALSKTIVSIIGISFILTVFASILNTSSMGWFWSMINQMQLLFLLFLTRAFIPLDVEQVIQGEKIVINFPRFIGFQSVDWYQSLMDKFDFGLTDSRYQLLDINSDSIILNTSPVFLVIALTIPLHLWIFLISKWPFPISSENKWFWVISKIKLIITKIFLTMTLGWYIRYILEMNQYILISSVYEIYSFNASSTLRIVSFALSNWTLIFLFLLILFVFYLSCSSYELVEDKHNTFGEFFSGVEMQKKNKAYVLALMLRRIVFIILLVTLVCIPSWILICVLSLIQFGYTTYFAIIRPYKVVKGNLIELINEIFFLCPVKYSYLY